MENVDRQMPRYKSHKTVWALQIEKIEAEGDGGAVLTPVEEGYAPFKVDVEYMDKHKPHEGGYFVTYDDGYKSFSPAKAFEDGYEPIDEGEEEEEKEATETKRGFLGRRG